MEENPNEITKNKVVEEKVIVAETINSNTEANAIRNEKKVENRAYLEKRSKVKKTIWYICGLLEVLFAFRLIFKVLGANPASGFVSIIYSVSGVFLAPFNGIFRSAVTEGIETKAVLEPMTIIAMIVYALIVYGIVRLIEIYDPQKNL